VPVEIRDEQPDDAPAIHALVTLGFGRPAEADLVDALRRARAVLVSLVAELDGELVGHALLSPVVLDAGGTAAGLAPLAVLPARQHAGVGSALVRAALSRCRAIGLPAVFVLGEPHFYRRFGFSAAARRGLRCVYPDAEEAFMVVELEPAWLAGREGLARYRPEFDQV
jgi:putative acetyltransferase